MGRIVILTGTDVGVGKTWVACQLAAGLNRRGVDVRAVKLIETGTPAEISPQEDGVLLAAAAGQEHPRAALRRYSAPVSAAEAADIDGKPHDLTVIEAELNQIAVGARFTLVEGTGGLFEPLTWKRNLLDVARRQAAPVLLIAADRRGTLNHTLLTLAMLDFAGAECIGVVFNPLPDDPPDSTRGRNAAALRKAQPELRVTESSNPDWVETVYGWFMA